jgi:hypothetical protein
MVLDRATSTEMRRLNSMITAYHRFYEPEQDMIPQQHGSYVQELLAKVFEPHRRQRI